MDPAPVPAVGIDNAGSGMGASPAVGADGLSPPPAYKTVCGVNGPLVVLDNVKVGAILPASDKWTPQRWHWGLCGD